MYKPKGGKPRIRENVNDGIRAKELRVVFPDGNTQLMTTVAALAAARSMQLDLIVVSPNAVPPVAKIIECGKFDYDNKKKQKAAKKNQHIQQTKEIKFRPNTDDHDYEFKKNHAVEFLKASDKVKATVLFKGREIVHANLGRELLTRLAADLAGVGSVEGNIKVEGKAATMFVVPLKKN